MDMNFALVQLKDKIHIHTRACNILYIWPIIPLTIPQHFKAAHEIKEKKFILK